MRHSTRARTIVSAAAVALAAASVGGCGSKKSSAPAAGIPQATPGELAAAGLGKLPLAPSSRRIDVAGPRFSNPTRITNPLFPISELRSAVLSGRVDGKAFHTETTLLPGTRIFEWPRGHQVKTLVSQYAAFLDGRIEEVALDHYAQADDGSVWYFGEDVFNYKDGAIADLAGTWFAGPEHPPAMIMPGRPQVGDVYRPENIPGLVFEEVTVKQTGKTVAGPRGPVRGAIVGRELHDDGSLEDKTFAPGYGEFFTAGGGDVEAMALAVPTDALSEPVPNALTTIERAADDAFAAVRGQRWGRAAAYARRVSAAWNAYRAEPVPPRLATEMRRAVASLSRSVRTRERTPASTAALDVAQSALDLQLRHRPVVEVDRARLGLWARQVVVDASAGDAAGVAGDVATLEWVRDRVAHALSRLDRVRVDTHLRTLRITVTEQDLAGAATEAARLEETLGRT